MNKAVQGYHLLRVSKTLDEDLLDVIKDQILAHSENYIRDLLDA